MIIDKTEAERGDILGGPAIQRMLAQQTLYARLSFTNAMEQFEKELERYSNGLRQYVAKQIAIVGGDPDLDYAESCIENGKIHAFVDNYQLEERQARDMLEAVTLRQQELEALERTIVEVRDLFVETALLVAAQGSVIDNIELHVERAAAEAASGRKQLKSAGKKKRSALKKKAILGAIGSAVAVGLITTVVIL
ncbi:Syntaxin-1A [Frankliniella fusca]|uniref:Syntaxin-1A n=1 Tax=Frankliniella fusca TaxID=407009 RepID=A0AAE1GY36_9NEOP|nr:Syntaxin-1A [Frankliniella fusca]